MTTYIPSILSTPSEPYSVVLNYNATSVGNDTPISYYLNPSEFGRYRFIDYALVGGGGGGGYADKSTAGARAAGGGGGSGYLLSSFPSLYQKDVGSLRYTILPSYKNNDAIPISNYNTIQVIVGQGGYNGSWHNGDTGADGGTGGNTSIVVTYNDNTETTTKTALGGGGGQGGQYKGNGGRGGNGFHGGGGATGGNTGGNGGTGFGGTSGNGGSNRWAGRGGGHYGLDGTLQSGDGHSRDTSLTGENASGSGAGGTAVILTYNNGRTGGHSAASYETWTNESSTKGVDWTGGGGGGASNNVGDGYMGASRGGRGYAIIVFRN